MADIFGNFGSKISAAYELAKRLGNVELSMQISDLQMELADLKSAYADLKNQNTELKAEIKALNERLEGKGNRGGITQVSVVRV